MSGGYPSKQQTMWLNIKPWSKALGQRNETEEAKHIY